MYVLNERFQQLSAYDGSYWNQNTLDETNKVDRKENSHTKLAIVRMCRLPQYRFPCDRYSV